MEMSITLVFVTAMVINAFVTRHYSKKADKRNADILKIIGEQNA